MCRILLTVLSVLCWSPIGLAGSGDAKKDLDSLQGTWEVTKATFEGKEKGPATEVKKLVFKGTQIIHLGDDKSEEPLLVELDPKQKPRAIDLWKDFDGEKRGPIRGIYQVDGDSLKLCWSVKIDGPRPKDFAPKAKSLQVYMELRRVKK